MLGMMKMNYADVYLVLTQAIMYIFTICLSPLLDPAIVGLK
jgi:hypothetical protein